MKVVALCNKLSRSRSGKLRGDEEDVNGNVQPNGGLLQVPTVSTESPSVSNMTTGKPVVVRFIS